MIDKKRLFIGKRFLVKGLNEAREVIIYDFYYLGNNKRYPVFACKVISDTKYFKPGDRENFLYRDIIKAGRLVKEIKVLSA